MRARTDLGVVAVLTLAAVVVAALLPGSLAVLRALVAIPLVLALPGYAVASAIFRPQELRISELVPLSIAVSIATTIFAALLLQAFGMRLETAPWMGLLALVTVAAAAVGTARGHARVLVAPHVALRTSELLALVGAVALLSGAAALGFSPLGAPKGTAGASALWIVPRSANTAVDVGVISDETHVTTYTVQLTVAGKPGLRFGPITLTPGGAWHRVVAVGAGKPVVRAVLHTAADPSVVYADVALRCWCTAVAPPGRP